jgi:predicted ArsR family transcriptional regulator
LTYFHARIFCYIDSMKKRSGSGPRKKGHFGSRRAEVVNLLQRGVGTVAELAARTRLTDNAVRSHLLALEREGLVHRKGSLPGKRRPHDFFQLTSRAEKILLQASDASLNALLDALKQRLSGKQLRELLEGGGASLAARFATNGAKKSLRNRVQTAARLLNALGGAARVERDENGFCIRSQGCPLKAVVAEHPETCLLVENFLARVIRAQVSEHCQRGDVQPRCRFAITTGDTNTANS